jgi:uncharacterized protein YdcH (DUF465 family)
MCAHGNADRSLARSEITRRRDARTIAVDGSVDYRRTKDAVLRPGGSVTPTTEGSKQAVLEQLTQEHRRLDEQLKILERRRALTPAEQVEIVRLKKQKLLTKDRIARLS